MLVIDEMTLSDLMAKIGASARQLADTSGKRVIVKTMDGQILKSVALAALSIATGDSVVERR